MHQQLPYKLSLDEFIAFDDSLLDRHDYIDGDIFIKDISTIRHALIVTNCMAEIHTQVLGQGYVTFASNMRLQIDATKIIYPDIFITQESSMFADENETIATDPIVIVEVISPSSENYDLGLKGEFYRSLPSVQAYLILDQDKPRARLYTRHELGWLLREFNGLDATIPLDALECQLKLSEAYLKVFDE